MITCIKIPKKRLPVLIGKQSEIKKKIENDVGVKLRLIRTRDEIEIEGDSLNVMTAENIVKAISRGFSPAKAFILKDEDKILVILNISDNRYDLLRIKSRLIGAKGKSRRTLEKLSRSYISVYGRTVAVIGDPENVKRLCNGIEKLIKGTSHRFVYQSLERSFSKLIKRNKRIKREGKMKIND